MIKLKEPFRFAAVVLGTAICLVVFGWPAGIAYMVGTFVGSFKLSE